MKHTRLFAGVLTAFLLILCLCPSALAEDGYNDFYFDDLGMTVSIPEGVRVLTQELEDGDPNLEGLEMSAAHLAYLLSVDGIYLEASQDGMNWVMDISAFGEGDRRLFSDFVGDLSEYGSWYLGELLQDFNEQNTETPAEFVKLDGMTFLFSNWTDSGFVYRTYISLLNGYEIWIQFAAPAGPASSYSFLWDDILSHIRFENRHIRPAGETGAEDAPAEPSPPPTPAPMEAEPVLYVLEEDEFTIELPADLLVLTRGMDENDPALTTIGMRPEEVDAELQNAGFCLNAFPRRMTWGMTAATESSLQIRLLGNAALLDEESFDRLFDHYTDSLTESLAEAIGADADTLDISDEGSVVISGIRYRRVTLALEQDASPQSRMTQYITACGGRLYCFSFSGDISRPEQEEILATVQLTAEPTGITELKSGLGLDWGRIGRDAAIGAVTAGVLGGLAAVLGRRKKGGAHADGGSDRPQDSGAPYSIPGASGHADSEEENTP